jgi:tRNA1Val (adenine37-N6)-methyltransferase
LVFKFKSFSIKQEKSAMKIGTDGVLLGAWVSPHSTPKTILDVGTGTGLIAIMMAQRFKNATIDAVEIEQEAAQEAHFNMLSSPWSEYLKVAHCSLQDFKTDISYDLIVCNPPFYRNTTVSKDIKRATARNNESLSLEYLIDKSAELLNANGELAIIVPVDELKAVQNQAKISQLHINNLCYLKGHEKSAVKRILLKLGKYEREIKKEHLTIEKRRHIYTEEYKYLCKDFYLNL